MTGKNIIRRYVRSLSTNDRQPQELARSEIDLIIRSLCKYGQRWAIGCESQTPSGPWPASRR